MSTNRRAMPLSEAKILECKALAYFFALRFGQEAEREEEEDCVEKYIEERRWDLAESIENALSQGMCPLGVCSIVAAAQEKARDLVTNDAFQNKETEGKQ